MGNEGGYNVPQGPPLDATPPTKGKGRAGITPGRPIKRSGKARAEGQRKIAYDAQPAEFLVALMQGETVAGADGPASIRERADIAKFLVNKLVGNAAPHQAEDVQGVANADWVKQIEAQSTQGRLEGE